MTLTWRYPCQSQQSWLAWNTSCDLEDESEGAVGQSLERRGALVPPKIDIRGSEGARGSREGAEQGEQGGRPGRESSASSYSLTSRGTESDLNTSVAVIPPMQICPGDLLVYSRVLAHKASGYGKDTYMYLP